MQNLVLALVDNIHMQIHKKMPMAANLTASQGAPTDFQSANFNFNFKFESLNEFLSGRQLS